MTSASIELGPPGASRIGDGNAAALPWRALIALGAATTVMVSAEMLPTAMLEPMSTGLGVSEARTGQLVSLWALTVVVASLPLARLTRRLPRRALLVAGLGALAASSAGTALASGYLAAAAVRMVGAAAVGVLWATANAHLADLVPEQLLGRAVSVVLGGATLGIVVGTPLSRLVSDAAGWRAAFWVLAVAAASSAAWVHRAVPDRPRRAGPPSAPASSAGLRPVVSVVALVGVVLAGHYGAYTFVTRLADDLAGALPGGASTLLFVFGVASAAGVGVAARSDGARPGPLVVAAAATAATLAALPVTGAAWAGMLLVAGWGLASGALAPLAQTAVLRRAGEQHRELASALIPVVFNLGIGIGSALAAGLVGTAGLHPLPWAAAGVVAIGALGLARAAGQPAPAGDPASPTKAMTVVLTLGHDAREL